MESGQRATEEQAATARPSDTPPRADPAEPCTPDRTSLRIVASASAVGSGVKTPTGAANASSYDLLPYDSKAIKATHPDRMATIASLSGLDAPELSRCRVLELGCARGDNLMAMATSLPGASFLGIDASTRQIEDGKKRLAATGLGNVELRRADILELGPEIGEFDYILCHGVYSWVPRPAADRILELSARLLSPKGVAYVSYNTFPGWHSKTMLREMMRFHVRGLSDPEEQAAEARKLVHFLAEHAREDEGLYRAFFQKLAEHLDAVADYYLFHEFLEEYNEPVTFTEFADRARAAGLQYVASASPNSWELLLSDEAKRVLSGMPDRIAREQYLDYLANQAFRRSLLCHTGVGLAAEPSADVVAGLQVTARATPVHPNLDIASTDPEQFVMPDGQNVTTNRPLIKATLVTLAEEIPRFLRFEALWERVRSRLRAAEPQATATDLSQNLLLGYRAGILDLSRTPPPFATEVSRRPVTSTLARIQAAEDEYVSTLLHGTMKPSDLERLVIRCLDGTCDAEAVIAKLCAAIAAGDYELIDPTGATVRDSERIRRCAQEAVATTLPRLARSHLLMA